MVHMPQEIEVWYILPAIRRELAKVLVEEHNLTQKKVAELMGITEAAVSQYIKSKRGKDVVFDKAVIAEIRKSANTLIKSKHNLMREMKRLTALSDVRLIVCRMHKGHDKHISEYCDTCRSC